MHSHIRRWRAGLALAIAFLGVSALSARAVVIDFEDITTTGPGTGGQTAVTNQYASLGVTFNFPVALDYSKGIPLANFAHSGTIAIEQCYAQEFCTSPIAMDFTAGQARVKVWVGLSYASQSASVVVLRGFNAGGTLVTSTTLTLPARPSGPTNIRFPMEIGRFAADIRRVEVDMNDPSAVTNGLAVDDVEFDTVGPPPPCPATTPPGLTLNSPANGTVTRCDRFLFRDTVVNTDPFARRTVTVRGPAMGQTNTWTSQANTASGGPTWIYGMLFPGANTITDRVENCRGATERAVTITYDPIPGDTRIVVLGFEPSQSVQRLPTSVPLIADKRTVMRVYLKLEGSLASLPGVSGRLSAFAPGANPRYDPGPPIAPYSVQSLNTITVLPTTTLQSARQSLTVSLNFEMPAGWTQEGQAHFRLTSLAVDGCDLRLNVENADNRYGVGSLVYNTFTPAPPVRLRIVDVPYRTTAGGTVHTPRDLDVNLLRSWLGRAYPTPRVMSSRTSLPIRTGTPDSSFNADDINSQLQDMRSMETSNGSVDRRTHYYGMVHDGGGFMRGKADGIPSWVASGPTGPGTYGWDTDGSYGDWYGGHELGHTFKRFHAKYCGAQECVEFIWTFCPDGYVAYPFGGGFLDNNAVYGNFGLDVGDASLGVPMTVYRPDVAHDVMTYCDNEWLSDFTYNGILGRLRDENPSGFAPMAAQRSGDALLLSATMNLTQETARLRPFWRMPNLELTERPETSHYSIQLKDASNNNLAVYLFAPKVDTEALEGEEVTASMSEVVPWVDGTRRIVLMRDGVELASRTVTPNTPTVQILSPNGGENLNGATAEVAWQASDPDAQPLTYALQYSRDAGQTWQVVATGLTTTTYVVDLDGIPGSATALFRVFATDGVNTGMDASDATFVVRLKVPTARISAPASNAAYTSADTVLFRGEAFDMEDGDMDGASLQWFSDLQGALGTGRSVSRSLLPGTHTVNLTATDSDGGKGEASVTLVVTAAAPVASAGPNRYTAVGVPVSLDGSASLGVPSLAYTWEIVDGPAGHAATLSNANTAAPSLTADRVGEYTVQLTVTDAMNTAAVTQVRVIAGSAIGALRVAGGLASSTPADMLSMNAENGGASANVIDIVDAVRLAIRANALSTLGRTGHGVVTVTNNNQYGGIVVGKGYGVYLDDPRLNGAPDQRVLATHQFVGAYNTSPLAVWYDETSQKWVAFNDAPAGSPLLQRPTLAVGEKVNYAFGPHIGVVTRGGAGGPFPWGVYLDDPGLNFNPGAVVLSTHNYVSNNGDPLGVWYNGSKWVAYHETGKTIPDVERYFWANAGASGGRVVRNAGNAFSTYGVYLDDARINGNSAAVILAQHAGQASYNKSVMGVWYDGSRWVVYNEDRSPFANGEAVHYMIAQNITRN